MKICWFYPLSSHRSGLFSVELAVYDWPSFVNNTHIFWLILTLSLSYYIHPLKEIWNLNKVSNCGHYCNHGDNGLQTWTLTSACHEENLNMRHDSRCPWPRTNPLLSVSPYLVTSSLSVSLLWSHSFPSLLHVSKLSPLSSASIFITYKSPCCESLCVSVWLALSFCCSSC